MFHNVKSLLDASLNRYKIREQVTIAQVIEQANLALEELLPPGRGRDAAALSLRDGILKVECVSGASAQFVKERADTLRQAIVARVPSADVQRILVVHGTPAPRP